MSFSIPCDASSTEGEYSVFVGDLAPTVTDAELVNVFRNPSTGLRPGAPKFIKPFLSCTSANVIFDNITGKRKGFAFVRFTQKADMLRALTEMNGILCCSRPMRVSAATSRGANRDRAHSVTTNSYGLLSPQVLATSVSSPALFERGGPAVAAKLRQITGVEPVATPQLPTPSPSPALPESWVYAMAKEYVRQNKKEVQELSTASDPYNTTVFIGNHSPSVTEDHLIQVFSPFGPIHYVKVPAGMGVSFVQFVHKEDATRAIDQMDGVEIGGNLIRTSWGRSNLKAAQAALDAVVEQEAQELVTQVASHFGLQASYLPSPEPTSPLPTSPQLALSNEFPRSPKHLNAILASPRSPQDLRLPVSNMLGQQSFGLQSGWGGLKRRNDSELGLTCEVPKGKHNSDYLPAPPVLSINLPTTCSPPPLQTNTSHSLEISTQSSVTASHPTSWARDPISTYRFSHLCPLDQGRGEKGSRVCAVSSSSKLGNGDFTLSSVPSMYASLSNTPGAWTPVGRALFASHAREMFLATGSICLSDSSRTSISSKTSLDDEPEGSSDLQDDLPLGVKTMVDTLVGGADEKAIQAVVNDFLEAKVLTTECLHGSSSRISHARGNSNEKVETFEHSSYTEGLQNGSILIDSTPYYRAPPSGKVPLPVGHGRKTTTNI